MSDLDATHDSPIDPPIVPPATIGMLGGGQLGKYALAAANAMGYRTLVVDPDPHAPARVVADVHLVAPYDDPAALTRLVASCSVVTTEFENAPARALDDLARSIRVAPSADAVAVAQDRLVEKAFMVDHGIDVGPFAPAPAGLDEDQRRAVRQVSTNGAVVKTARLGYDGKGQRRATGPEQVDSALVEFADTDCIVEALLDLRAEISVIVARTHNGARAHWPVAENVHVDGILDVSVVPARIDAALAARAVQLATTIAEELAFVGVLAVEMFMVDDGLLLVNEIAPRPHNSGHWTLDASVTSQFEQQIRAVCGVGLGATDMTAPAVAMVNLLGDLWFTSDDVRRPVEPNWAHALADPAAKLHLYGKTEARPGRKMGHLTVTADSSDAAERRALDLRAGLNG